MPTPTGSPTPADIPTQIIMAKQQLESQQQQVQQRQQQLQSQEVLRQVSLQQRQQYGRQLADVSQQIAARQQEVSQVQKQVEEQQAAQLKSQIQSEGFNAGAQAAVSGRGWVEPAPGSLAAQPGFREAFAKGYAEQNRAIASSSSVMVTPGGTILYQEAGRGIEFAKQPTTTATITSIPSQKLALPTANVIGNLPNFQLATGQQVYVPPPSQKTVIERPLFDTGTKPFTQFSAGAAYAIGQGIKNIGIGTGEYAKSIIRVIPSAIESSTNVLTGGGIKTTQNIFQTAFPQTYKEVATAKESIKPSQEDISRTAQVVGVLSAASIFPKATGAYISFVSGREAFGRIGQATQENIPYQKGYAFGQAVIPAATAVVAAIPVYQGVKQYFTQPVVQTYTNPLTGRQAKTQLYVDTQRQDILAPMEEGKIAGRSTRITSVRAEQLQTTPFGQTLQKVGITDPFQKFVITGERTYVAEPLQGTLGTSVAKQVYSEVLGKDVSQTIKPAIYTERKVGSNVIKVSITGGEQVPYLPNEYATLPGYKKSLVGTFAAPETAKTYFEYPQSIYVGKYNIKSGQFALSEAGKRLSRGESFVLATKIKEGQFSDVYGVNIAERAITSTTPRASGATLRYPFLSKVYTPEAAEQMKSFMAQTKEATAKIVPEVKSAGGIIVSQEGGTPQILDIAKAEVIKPIQAAKTTTTVAPIFTAPRITAQVVKPIQIIKAASQAAAAVSLIKQAPAQRISPLMTQVPISKQNVIQMQVPTQQTTPAQPTATREGIAQTAIQTPVQVSTPVQINVPNQLTVQIPTLQLTPTQPTTDVFVKPEVPFYYPGLFTEEIKKRRARALALAKSFRVQIRRRGKFFDIGGESLPLGRALKLGATRTKETLAATFRLVPSRTPTISPDISYQVPAREFTTPKRPVGEIAYVERLGRRLSERSAVSEIQFARRSKKKSRRIFGI